MAKPGRPPLLTDALIERLTADVEMGLGVTAAARLAGCSGRSVRRWQAQGRRELDDLSGEARLVLALAQAEREARKLDWKVAVAELEAIAPERWAGPPLADFDVDGD